MLNPIDALIKETEVQFERVYGHDDCLIGVSSCGMRLVYSADKIIAQMMVRDKMSRMEAAEYFDYNIGGAYSGPNTPLFVFALPS